MLKFSDDLVDGFALLFDSLDWSFTDALVVLLPELRVGNFPRLDIVVD